MAGNGHYECVYGLVRKQGKPEGPVECVVLCMKNGEQRTLIKNKIKNEANGDGGFDKITKSNFENKKKKKI